MPWLKFNPELLTKRYHSLLLKSLDLVIYLEAKKKKKNQIILSHQLLFCKQLRKMNV